MKFKIIKGSNEKKDEEEPKPREVYVKFIDNNDLILEEAALYIVTDEEYIDWMQILVKDEIWLINKDQIKYAVDRPYKPKGE